MAIKLLDQQDYSFFNSDDALFHYTTVNTAIEKILYENQFKFNTLKKSGDPFEYKKQMILAYGCANREVNNPNNELFNDKINYINDMDKYRLNYCKMACFSINIQYQKGYFKSRLWSEYANNHTGVCLVFSIKSFIDTINKKYKKLFNQKIEYVDNDKIKEIYHKYISMKVDNPGEESYDKLKDMFFKHLKKTNILFVKHDEYSSESEYRIIVYEENDKELFIPLTNCLKGIIIGENFSKGHSPSINKFKETYKVPIAKIDIDEGALVINWYTDDYN